MHRDRTKLPPGSATNISRIREGAVSDDCDEVRRVTWPALPGARYRLELLDGETGEPLAEVESEVPSALLPPIVEPRDALAWQVRARREPVPDWHVILPPRLLAAAIAARLRAPGPESCQLTWPAIAEASAYRLALLDPAAGKSRTVYRGPENRYALPEAMLPARDTLSYRVEVELAAGDMHTLVPWSRMPALASPGFRIIALESAEPAPAYRFYLRDEHEDRIVLDVISGAPRFAVDPNLLPYNHQLRYRVFAWRWRQRKWAPLMPYTRLEPGAAQPGAPVDGRRLHNSAAFCGPGKFP